MARITQALLLILLSAISQTTAKPTPKVKIENWEICSGNIDEQTFQLSIASQPNSKLFLPQEKFINPKDMARGNTVITYRKKINLSNNFNPKDLGIHVSPCDYPYIIYINNRLVLRRGFPNTSYCASDFRGRFTEIIDANIKKGDSLLVVMQTFPEGLPSAAPTITLSDFKTVSTMFFWQSLIMHGVVTGLVLISFFLAIIFLIIWRLTDKTWPEYLYFSLANLTVVGGFSNVVLSSPTINDIPLWSISRALYGLTATFLYFMVIEIVGLTKQFSKIGTAILIMASIFSGVMLVQHEKYMVESIFQHYVTFQILPTLILTTLLILINLKKGRNRRQIFILIGLLITFATGIHDTYYFKTYQVPYFWWVAYGFATLQLLTLFTFIGDIKELFDQNITFTNRITTSSQKNNELALELKTIKDDTKAYLKKRDDSILIVEDNNINRLVVTKLLSRKGYKTTIAINGLEAVEMVKNSIPKLILMDIQMPEMDGFTATKIIRKSGFSENDLPIIALTAHANKKDCLDSGMNDYLSKPINTNELFKKIEQYS